MAQPSNYSRAYDFTVDAGSATRHSKVNDELDKVSLSIGQIRNNLAKIQNDDWTIKSSMINKFDINEALLQAQNIYNQTQNLYLNTQQLGVQAETSKNQAVNASNVSVNASIIAGNYSNIAIATVENLSFVAHNEPFGGNATVSKQGTAPNIVVNIGIPLAPLPNWTINSNQSQTSPNGSLSISGSYPNQTLNFTMGRADYFENISASILPAGVNATATIGGTSPNRSLSFGIPGSNGLVPIWSAGVYAVGALVTDGGVMYRCITATTAGDVAPNISAKWGVVNISGNAATATTAAACSGNAATASSAQGGSALETALNNKMIKSSLGSNINLNDIVTAGCYRVDVNLTNKPEGADDFGQLLVIHGGGDTISQIYTGYTNSNIFARNGNPSSVGGSGAWTNWALLISDTNFLSYAMPKPQTTNSSAIGYLGGVGNSGGSSFTLPAGGTYLCWEQSSNIDDSKSRTMGPIIQSGGTVYNTNSNTSSLTWSITVHYIKLSI